MSVPPTKPSGGGLSLYADLLEPDRQKSSSGASISSAPVKYDIQRSGSAGEEDTAVQQKKKDASLKFQPIKRPQVPQKSKPKTASSSGTTAHRLTSSISTSAAAASSPDWQQQHGRVPSSTPSQQMPGIQKSNFDDWVGDGDDDFFYQDNRARGGRKKRKKNNKPQERMWDWDDIYDPTLPNNYADYKNSEEQHREIRDWKARLYHHQMKEARRAQRNSGRASEARGTEQQPNMMFAPPSKFSFAPPSFDAPAAPRADEDDDDYYPREVDTKQQDKSPESRPSFAPQPMADTATADEVYRRRMQMSGMVPSEMDSVPDQPVAASVTPPVDQATEDDLAVKRAEAQAKIAAFKAKLLQKQKSKQASTAESVPPPPPPPEEGELPSVEPALSSATTRPSPAIQQGSVISRGAVRYDVPPPPSDLPAGGEDVNLADAGPDQAPAPSEDQPRSSRPGQKGFAERLLKKYGWEKGHGLGAQADGIVTPLSLQAAKRKKRSDAEGGGWAAPANMGKIVGGKRRKIATDGPGAEADVEQDPRLGKMSSVVKMSGMLDGLDVQHEIEDNNVMQEIGDQMGGQYGNVERVFIWKEEMGGQNDVFVKFTSQLSGLRAVNAMNAMNAMNANKVRAMFWDEEKFGKEEYA